MQIWQIRKKNQHKKKAQSCWLLCSLYDEKLTRQNKNVRTCIFLSLCKKMKTNRSKLRIKEVRTCSLCSWSAGPIPDRIRMAGDPYVPAVNITSLSVCTLNEIPLCINSIPCALLLEIKTCKIGVKFDIGSILHMYIVISKTLITSQYTTTRHGVKEKILQ